MLECYLLGCFMDDIFNFKADRAKAIARGLIERDYGLKLTFPNGFRGDILDEELVVLLKKAGMYRCMVAVESAVPRMQKVMKKNLKIEKVRRIVDKLAPDACVQSLLVLDASQGQNGLKQAMAFAQAAGLTGVVLTKLDGSSRGGVALAVSSEAGLPIRFIGAGEGIRDLRPFNSFEFVEALLAK